MNEWIDKQVNRQTDRYMNGWLDECMDSWIDKIHIDRYTELWMED